MQGADVLEVQKNRAAVARSSMWLINSKNTLEVSAVLVSVLVFKTSEVLRQRLVGSTPTSSAKSELSKSDLTLPRVYKSID